MNVGVVIPAYNAGSQIDHVLSNVLTVISADRVLLVNDGSTDDTALIAASFGVQIVTHAENRGKGAALKSGFSRAAALGWDYVITLDADGQHDTASIPRFLERAQSEALDLVIGYRPFRLGVMPPERIFSNRVSSALVSLLAGKWIPDSQCGFRMIRVSRIDALDLKTDHYELETELLVKALRQGCTVGFCPVPVIYTETESHIQHGLDTWRFLKLYFQLILSRKTF